MSYWAYVFIIFQCQSDGCSFSSKYGSVVWPNLDRWRSVVSHFRKCCAPHSSFHLGSACVNFSISSFSFTLCNQCALGIIAYAFNEVATPWILFTNFSRKAKILLISAKTMAASILRPCRHEMWGSKAWTDSTDVPPKEHHWSLYIVKTLLVHYVPSSSLNSVLWMLSNVVDRCSVLFHMQCLLPKSWSSICSVILRWTVPIINYKYNVVLDGVAIRLAVTFML